MAKASATWVNASAAEVKLKASARARSPVTDSMRLCMIRHVQAHSLSYFISNRHWAPSQLIYKCTTQAAGRLLASAADALTHAADALTQTLLPSDTLTNPPVSIDIHMATRPVVGLSRLPNLTPVWQPAGIRQGPFRNRRIWCRMGRRVRIHTSGHRPYVFNMFVPYFIHIRTTQVDT